MHVDVAADLAEGTAGSTKRFNGLTRALYLLSAALTGSVIYLAANRPARPAPVAMPASSVSVPPATPTTAAPPAVMGWTPSTAAGSLIVNAARGVVAVAADPMLSRRAPSAAAQPAAVSRPAVAAPAPAAPPPVVTVVDQPRAAAVVTPAHNVAGVADAAPRPSAAEQNRIGVPVAPVRGNGPNRIGIPATQPPPVR